MKENRNDSAPVLERFGRDRRRRIVTETTERVEHRPRSQRDAADSEHTPSDSKPFKRASYNPRFTVDNRPAFGKPQRSYDDKPRYGGERPRFEREERPYGDRPHRDEERPRRTYDDKPRYGSERPRFEREERPYGDRPYRDEERPRRMYGEKPAYGSERPRFEREERPYGDRPHRDEERPRRAYGEKPGYGGKSAYGAKSPRNGKPGDRKFGGKRAAGSRTEARPASYPKFDPAKQTGEIRLNRFLAQSGLCSRREADDYITAGLVTVNGELVTELGTKVLPTDEVKFNDSRVQGEKRVYLVLNKPKGYVTSLEDPHADKTVMDLVKGACAERIYPVGRLDKNSVGLLLFTNDGDLTKQLTHPSYQKKKVYQVSLDKPLTRADMDRIAEGITLEDGEIYADEISYVKENRQEVGIEIHSGRNRIVRRIFEFLGYTVTKLDRVYYAGLTKKNLRRGEWRFLTREEVERLKSGMYE